MVVKLRLQVIALAVAATTVSVGASPSHAQDARATSQEMLNRYGQCVFDIGLALARVGRPHDGVGQVALEVCAPERATAKSAFLAHVQAVPETAREPLTIQEAQAEHAIVLWERQVFTQLEQALLTAD